MKILFLCTHNACRSVLCEAIAGQLAGPRIIAASAGSEPAGRIHPLTLRALAARGYPTERLRSKGLEAVKAFAPAVVITVCDSAAGESCPLWLDDAVRVHWGLLDPSRVPGGDEVRAGAFDATINLIEYRIRTLLEQPFENFTRGQLVTALNDIAGGV